MNAPDLPNKDKPKGRPGRTFPVTFVVDQQLEACVLAIKKNPRRSNVQIDLPNAQKDADKTGFSASLFHDGIATTQVWGTMRRWEGTSTRVEGYAYTLNHDLTFGYLAVMLGFFMTLIPIPYYAATMNESGITNLGIGVIFILIIIAIATVVILIRPYANKRRLIRRLRGIFLTQ